MIVQKTIYLLFAVTLCVFSQNVSAKMFNCKIKVGDLTESFDFDSVKNQQGIGGNFNGQVYFISIKRKKISVKVQNSKTASQVQSSFSPRRLDFELSQTPGFDLSCKYDPVAPQAKPVEVKKEELKLDETTALEKFQAGLDFIASTSLKVKYNVQASSKRMRAVIFQKGRLYTFDDDSKRDLNGNWCMLQVKLELDQDTSISEGDRWQTVQYKTLKNNSSHTIYSYSFVDPVSARVTQRFKRYVPFNLACQIKIGEVFNQKMWREITGDRIKLYHNK